MMAFAHFPVPSETRDEARSSGRTVPGDIPHSPSPGTTSRIERDRELLFNAGLSPVEIDHLLSGGR